MEVKDRDITKLLSDDSWKYKKVCDAVVDIYSGIMPKISERKKGDYPAIQLRDISGLRSPLIYECKTFIDVSNIKNKRTATYGDLLVVYGSGVW